MSTDIARAPEPLRPDESLAAAGSAGASHVMALCELAARLEVDPGRGLTGVAAAARLASAGANELVEEPRRSRWLLFADQFKSVLILILVVAAALGAFVGDVKDVVVIGVVILLNATLGYYQEARAEAALATLKRMLAARTRVLCDGEQVEIDVAELVPGDIVLLESGDRVPADARLVDTHRMAVDESTLTGESVPVEKSAAVASVADRPLASARTWPS